MKLIFLGLSETEQNNFKGYASSETAQFKNAYERYVAWAAALGQKPWEEGTVGGVRNVVGANSESVNLIPI